MTAAQQAIDSTATAIERLRKAIHKRATKQVTVGAETQIIKATAHTWFNNHRNVTADVVGNEAVGDLDDEFRQLLSATGRATSRSKYVDSLKRIKRLLVQLETEYVVPLASPPASRQPETTNTLPQFSSLITDPNMQRILVNRWNECVKCVDADAPLAATVMMGGMLEGLLLARINQLPDKSRVFKAASAPKDRKTGAPLKLNEWGLRDYIDVAHELGWISKTVKDIGGVVRDYRNYIHPQKEHSHGVSIGPDDARMLWEVAKSITHQLLKP